MLERIVRTGPIQLATRAWLTRTGPCVVLVHGLGTNLESWASLVSCLQGRYSIVAFDRRGHGHSSDAISYTASDLAGDIAAVVAEFGFAEPIVIGHSVGAWDSLIYATRASVRAVICLDQAIAADDPVWAEPLTRHDGQEIPERGYTDGEWGERMAQGESELGAPLWPEIYGPMNERAVTRGPDGRLYYRPGRQARQDIRSGWPSFAAAGEPYAQISCPITVVLAQRNTGPIHDALRRLTARRQLEAVDADCDHDIHVQQPQLVAELVDRMVMRGNTST